MPPAAPLALSLKVDDALPVTAVMNPMVIALGVTPGALAVLVAVGAAVVAGAELVGVVLAGAVVAVAPFDELPHADATVAKATIQTTARARVRLMGSPPFYDGPKIDLVGSIYVLM